MSSSFIGEEPILDGLLTASVMPAPLQERGVSEEVASHILRGTSTLGLAIMVERGATFLANILAARFAGAAIFGAYSVGISTANNISTYAAGGIGSTATRFSGKYPYESGNYRTFARVLAVVSLSSAVVAAAVLFFFAEPIAQVLHKESLATLLRWASVSAAGMLLLECARGFFVGQRRLVALALISVLVGTGMVLVLPIIALHKHPAQMVAFHGIITLTAVAMCVILAKPLGLLARGGAPVVSFGAMLREVWGFGFIQLSGLLSANLAGWWMTALVARGDPTLVQMGFFAIASQLRNLTGIVPALLTEGSYAVIAMPDENKTRMPQRVMALCTFAATAVAFMLAALGIIVLPWAVRLMYGPHYSSAGVAAAIGMSVAVLQMGNAPPSARVSVISIRSVAGINTLWALITASAGTVMMLYFGGAAGAMAVFLLAHIVAAILTFVVLARRDSLPAGLIPLFAMTTVGVLALSLLAVLRERMPAHALGTTVGMLCITLITGLGLKVMARRYGWLSALDKLNRYVSDARVSAVNFVRTQLWNGGAR